MKALRIASISISALLALAACTKQETEKTTDNSKQYSNTPAIKFIGVTPGEVRELDSLTFTVYYEDGNGDLGENNNPFAKNLFITDLRTNTTDSLRIPQLTPDNTSVPIMGNLKVVLTDILLKKNATRDTATFKIQVMDRAGNKSNVVTSTPVIINRN